MKKVLALAAVVAVLISALLLYARVKKARQETAFRMVIERFQRDLPMGTSQADVKKYLDSRRVQYNFVNGYGGGESDAYVIEIGEEPGGLRCEDWKVFVALVFDSARTLRGIRLDKQGACG